MKRGRKCKDDREHVNEHLEVFFGTTCPFDEGECL